MERREWRELVQLSKLKTAFARRIGRAQQKESIGAIPFVKGGPTKAFTRDHFLFYVLFSFLLIPRLSLGVKQSFLRNFLGGTFLKRIWPIPFPALLLDFSGAKPNAGAVRSISSVLRSCRAKGRNMHP